MKTLEERFWEKVNKTQPNHALLGTPCWLWVGAVCKIGYGRIRNGRVVRAAHRVAWFLHTGFWPTQHVLHKCDNPLCVNPIHLFEGTQRDNVKDMIAKGRHYNVNKFTRSTYANQL